MRFRGSPGEQVGYIFCCDRVCFHFLSSFLLHPHNQSSTPHTHTDKSMYQYAFISLFIYKLAFSAFLSLLLCQYHIHTRARRTEKWAVHDSQVEYTLISLLPLHSLPRSILPHALLFCRLSKSWIAHVLSQRNTRSKLRIERRSSGLHPHTPAHLFPDGIRPEPPPGLPSIHLSLAMAGDNWITQFLQQVIWPPVCPLVINWTIFFCVSFLRCF